MNYTFDFIRNGSSLTGKTNNSQFGASEIQEGKINGDEISFVEMMDSSIRVEYKAGGPAMKSGSSARSAISARRPLSPNA
jgi:hypothetical protein